MNQKSCGMCGTHNEVPGIRSHMVYRRRFTERDGRHYCQCEMGQFLRKQDELKKLLGVVV